MPYSINSVALIWVNFSYINEMNAHCAGMLYRHVKIPRSPVSAKASQSSQLTSLPPSHSLTYWEKLWKCTTCIFCCLVGAYSPHSPWQPIWSITTFTRAKLPTDCFHLIPELNEVLRQALSEKTKHSAKGSFNLVAPHLSIIFFWKCSFHSHPFISMFMWTYITFLVSLLSSLISIYFVHTHTVLHCLCFS